MSNGIRVTPADVTKSGSCMRGARQWFELHGLDYNGFVKDGLPIEELRAINCPLADRACDAAEARVPGGGQ